MSLEKLVICPCGHSFEHHEAAGCTHTTSSRACSCPHSATAVLDGAIAAEREAYRRQWHVAAAEPM